MRTNIPLYVPTIGAAEAVAVARVIESGWISHRSPEVAKFEAEFARAVGAKFAVGVSSGTTALHCALVSAGVKAGDEVIVPSLTYIASANAVVHCRARPVFCDVNSETWQIDPESAVKCMTDRTVAAIPVHLYGHPAPSLRLKQLTGLKIVEDCAEGLGTKGAGRVGAASAWSFFANKVITTGEGGMVTTNSAEIAEAARRFSHQGLITGSEYQHDRVGYNYRMTAMQAAFGRAQLRRLPAILKRKREIAHWYWEGLHKIGGVQFQRPTAGHSWWLVSIRVGQPNGLRRALAAAGVETRPIFPPLDCYEPYQQEFKQPEAAGIAGVSLPSWPGLKKKQVEFICTIIKEFYS